MKHHVWNTVVTLQVGSDLSVDDVHNVAVGGARVFAAEDGVIYGLDGAGVLYWHQHLGRIDGTERWAKSQQRMQVGSGIPWTNYKHVFTAEDAVFYVVG